MLPDIISFEPLQEVNNIIGKSHFDIDPVMRSLGVNIDRNLMAVDGRILDPPRIICGKGQQVPHLEIILEHLELSSD